MPKSALELEVEKQHARLVQHEAQVMREMAIQYAKVEESLRAEMLDLSLYLDELRLKGETITQARLLQMERYQTLIAEAERENAKFSTWASGKITNDQAEMLAMGASNGANMIVAEGIDAGIENLVFNRLNTSAIEYAIGFAADGSPLNKLLKASYPESVMQLTDDLVRGLAMGQGPRATAAQMAKNMAGNLDRALLIAVTEQNRALRAGSIQSMQASQVVEGYTRRTQKNNTVCAACLALDGKPIKKDETFASHPRCHCYAEPVLPGFTPDIPDGKAWFAEQSEADQIKILGPEKYKLYKDGKLDWGKVAVVHNDPIWGPTIKQGRVDQVTKKASKIQPMDRKDLTNKLRNNTWQPVDEGDRVKGFFESEKVHVDGDGDAIRKATPKSAFDKEYNQASINEAKVHDISNALGMDIVPPTVYRPENGGMSFQAFVPNAKTAMESGRIAREITGDTINRQLVKDPTQFGQMSLLDIVTGNWDRNPGNLLFDSDGAVWAIDNGMAFGRTKSIDVLFDTVLQYANGFSKWTDTRMLPLSSKFKVALQESLDNGNLVKTAGLSKVEEKKMIARVQEILMDWEKYYVEP